MAENSYDYILQVGWEFADAAKEATKELKSAQTSVEKSGGIKIKYSSDPDSIKDIVSSIKKINPEAEVQVSINQKDALKLFQGMGKKAFKSIFDDKEASDIYDQIEKNITKKLQNVNTSRFSSRLLSTIHDPTKSLQEQRTALGDILNDLTMLSKIGAEKIEMLSPAQLDRIIEYKKNAIDAASALSTAKSNANQQAYDARIQKEGVQSLFASKRIFSSKKALSSRVSEVASGLGISQEQLGEDTTLLENYSKAAELLSDLIAKRRTYDNLSNPTQAKKQLDQDQIISSVWSYLRNQETAIKRKYGVTAGTNISFLSDQFNGQDIRDNSSNAITAFIEATTKKQVRELENAQNTLENYVKTSNISAQKRTNRKFQRNIGIISQDGERPEHTSGEEVGQATAQAMSDGASATEDANAKIREYIVTVEEAVNAIKTLQNQIDALDEDDSDEALDKIDEYEKKQAFYYARLSNLKVSRTELKQKYGFDLADYETTATQIRDQGGENSDLYKQIRDFKEELPPVVVPTEVNTTQANEELDELGNDREIVVQTKLDGIKQAMDLLSQMKEKYEYAAIFNTDTGYSTQVYKGDKTKVPKKVAHQVFDEADGQGNSFLHTHPLFNVAAFSAGDIESAIKDDIKKGITQQFVIAGNEIASLNVEKLMKYQIDPDVFMKTFKTFKSQRETNYRIEHGNAYKYADVLPDSYDTKFAESIRGEFLEALSDAGIQATEYITTQMNDMIGEINQEMHRRSESGEYIDSGFVDDKLADLVSGHIESVISSLSIDDSAKSELQNSLQASLASIDDYLPKQVIDSLQINGDVSQQLLQQTLKDTFLKFGLNPKAFFSVKSKQDWITDIYSQMQNRDIEPEVDLSGLKSGLEEAKRELAEVRDELQKFKDIDMTPEGIKELSDRLREAQSSADIYYNSMIHSVDESTYEQLKEELDEAKNEAEALQDQLDQLKNGLQTKTSIKDFYEKYGLPREALDKSIFEDYTSLLTALGEKFGNINTQAEDFSEIEIDFRFIKELIPQLDLSTEKIMVIQSLLNDIESRMPGGIAWRIEGVKQSNLEADNFLKQIKQIIQPDYTVSSEQVETAQRQLAAAQEYALSGQNKGINALNGELQSASNLGPKTGDSVGQAMEEISQKAEHSAESVQHLVDTLEGVGYHATKTEWETFDFDKTKPAQMGSGMYLSPDENVGQFAKFTKNPNIKEVEIALQKCFILTNKYISSISDINDILGTSLPDDASAKEVLSAIRKYSKESKSNSDTFRNKMLGKGYQGMYVSDYLANVSHKDELVIYDPKALENMKSYKYDEFKTMDHSNSGFSFSKKLVNNSLLALDTSAIDKQREALRETEEQAYNTKDAIDEVINEAGNRDMAPQELNQGTPGAKKIAMFPQKQETEDVDFRSGYEKTQEELSELDESYKESEKFVTGLLEAIQNAQDYWSKSETTNDEYEQLMKLYKDFPEVPQFFEEYPQHLDGWKDVDDVDDFWKFVEQFPKAQEYLRVQEDIISPFVNFDEQVHNSDGIVSFNKDLEALNKQLQEVTGSEQNFIAKYKDVANALTDGQIDYYDALSGILEKEFPEANIYRDKDYGSISITPKSQRDLENMGLQAEEAAEKISKVIDLQSKLSSSQKVRSIATNEMQDVSDAQQRTAEIDAELKKIADAGLKNYNADITAMADAHHQAVQAAEEHAEAEKKVSDASGVQQPPSSPTVERHKEEKQAAEDAAKAEEELARKKEEAANAGKSNKGVDDHKKETEEAREAAKAEEDLKKKKEETSKAGSVHKTDGKKKSTGVDREPGLEFSGDEDNRKNASNAGSTYKEEKNKVDSTVESEKAKFEELARELDTAIPKAIQKKNSAFEAEVGVVNKVVDSEKQKIKELKDAVNGITDSVRDKNKEFKKVSKNTASSSNQNDQGTSKGKKKSQSQDDTIQNEIDEAISTYGKLLKGKNIDTYVSLQGARDNGNVLSGSDTIKLEGWIQDLKKADETARKYSKTNDELANSQLRFNNALSSAQEYYQQNSSITKEYIKAQQMMNKIKGLDQSRFSEQFNALQNSLEGLKSGGKDLKSFEQEYNNFISLTRANRGNGDIISGSFTSIDDAKAKAEEVVKGYKTVLRDLSGSTSIDSNGMAQWSAQVMDAEGHVKQLQFAWSEAYGVIVQGVTQLPKQSVGIVAVFDRIKNKIKELATYWTARLFDPYRLIGSFKQIINIVKQYDDALTEMRKVSDESVSSLKEFQKSSFDIASSLGTTGLQIQKSTADWLRLGETFDEAQKSAKVSNLLLNVSEFESIDQATQALVSASQAYNELEKIDIVDKLNNIGNNFSVSTDQLAEGLQNSAAVLKTAGNDIDQSLALLTAGNAITQDISKTAAGIRTITLRIAGTKEAKAELEELGEDVSDFEVKTQSKVDAQVRKFTATEKNPNGVSVLDSNGRLRDTYDILLDISQVYADIVEKDNQLGTNTSNALLELLAGKTRSNILASILQNPQMLEDVYNMSAQSTGSALEENQKYLDSISGKMEQITNRFQELANIVIDSDGLKLVLDIANSLLTVITKLIEQFGGLNAILGVMSGVLLQKKGLGILDQNGKGGLANALLNAFIPSSKDTKKAVKTIFDVFSAEIGKMKLDPNDNLWNQLSMNMSEKQIKESAIWGPLFKNADEATKKTMTAVQGIQELQNTSYEASYGIASLTDGFHKLGGGIVSFLKYGVEIAAMMALFTALSAGITALLDATIYKEKRIIEAGINAKKQIDEITSSYKEMSEFADENASRYDKLSQGITRSNTGNLENISLSPDEFNEFLSLNKEMADMFPKLVSGYDAQGNAILDFGDSANTASDALKLLLEQERQLAEFKVDENLPDLAKSVTNQNTNLSKEVGQLQDEIESMRAVQRLLNNDVDNFTQNNIIDYAKSIGFSLDDNGIRFNNSVPDDNQGLKEYSDYLNTVINKVVNGSTFGFAGNSQRNQADGNDLITSLLITNNNGEQISFKQFKDFIEQFKQVLLQDGLETIPGDLDELQMKLDEDIAEMQANWNSIAPSLISSMSLYSKYRDLGEDSIGQQLQNIIAKQISDFDPSELAENEIDTFNYNPRKFVKELFLDPILKAVSNDKGEIDKSKKRIIGQLLSFNDTQLTGIKAQEEIDKKLMDLIPDDEELRKTIKVALGFELVDENGNTRSKYTDLENRVAGILGDNKPERSGIYLRNMAKNLTQEQQSLLVSASESGEFTFRGDGLQELIAWLDKYKAKRDEVKKEDGLVDILNNEGYSESAEKFKTNLSTLSSALETLRTDGKLTAETMKELQESFPNLTDFSLESIRNEGVKQLQEWIEKLREGYDELDDEGKKQVDIYSNNLLQTYSEVIATAEQARQAAIQSFVNPEDEEASQEAQALVAIERIKDLQSKYGEDLDWNIVWQLAVNDQLSGDLEDIYARYDERVVNWHVMVDLPKENEALQKNIDLRSSRRSTLEAKNSYRQTSGLNSADSYWDNILGLDEANIQDMAKQVANARQIFERSKSQTDYDEYQKYYQAYYQALDQRLQDQIAADEDNIKKVAGDYEKAGKEAEKFQAEINDAKNKGQRASEETYNNLAESYRSQAESMRTAAEGFLWVYNHAEDEGRRQAALTQYNTLSSSALSAEQSAAEAERGFMSDKLLEQQNQYNDLQTEAKEIEEEITNAETKHQKVSDRRYDELIKNGDKQIRNLERQRDTLTQLQSKTNQGTDTWRDYQSQIEDVESSIRSMENSQIGWFETMTSSVSTNAQELASTLSTAFSELTSNTGLSIDTMNSLVKQFSDLTGMDVSKIFYESADGMKMNTYAAEALVDAEYSLKTTDLKSEIERQNQIIERNKNLQTEAAREAVSAANQRIDAAERELSMLQALYDEQKDNFTNYQKFQRAQSTENAGSRYEDMQAYWKTAQENFGKGLTGTDEFRAYVQYFDQWGEDTIAAYNRNKDKITRYMTEDFGGPRNFLNDLVAKGYATTDGGSYSFAIPNVEKVAAEMGMSVEWFRDMLGRLEDYGATNDWVESELDGTEKIKAKMQELVEARLHYQELERQGASADVLADQQKVIDTLAYSLDNLKINTEAVKERSGKITSTEIQNAVSDIDTLWKTLGDNLEEGSDEYRAFVSGIRAYAQANHIPLDVDFKVDETALEEQFEGYKVSIAYELKPGSEVTDQITNQEAFDSGKEKALQLDVNDENIVNALNTVNSISKEDLEAIETNDGKWDDTFRTQEEALGQLADTLGLVGEERGQIVAILEYLGLITENTEKEFDTPSGEAPEKHEQKLTGVLRNEAKYFEEQAEAEAEAAKWQEITDNSLPVVNAVNAMTEQATTDADNLNSTVAQGFSDVISVIRGGETESEKAENKQRSNYAKVETERNQAIAEAQKAPQEHQKAEEVARKEEDVIRKREEVLAQEEKFEQDRLNSKRPSLEGQKALDRVRKKSVSEQNAMEEAALQQARETALAPDAGDQENSLVQLTEAYHEAVRVFGEESEQAKLAYQAMNDEYQSIHYDAETPEVEANVEIEAPETEEKYQIEAEVEIDAQQTQDVLDEQTYRVPVAPQSETLVETTPQATGSSTMVGLDLGDGWSVPEIENQEATVTIEGDDQATDDINLVDAKLNALNGSQANVTISAQDDLAQADADIEAWRTAQGSRPVVIPVQAQTPGGGGPVLKATKATGTMLAPAHASGTAYNVFNAIPITGAFADGKVGLDHDEEALVNELGTESLIRDGKWFLIPGGMHTENLKKGDVVLNHRQTADLVKSGKAAGHGTAYAQGSGVPLSSIPLGPAHVTNSKTGLTGAGMTRANATSSTLNTPHANPAVTAVNKNTDAIKNNTKASKDGKKSTDKAKTALDKFNEWLGKWVDWIDNRIDSLSNRIERFEKKADELIDYSKKNQKIQKAMDTLSTIPQYQNAQLKTKKVKGTNGVITEVATGTKGVKKGTLLGDTMRGAVRYQKQADKVMKKAVKSGLLSQKEANKIAKLIQTGKIDIRKYNENVRAVISAYEDWFGKSQDLIDSTYELKQQFKDLEQTKLDNITERFETLVGLFEAANTLSEAAVDYYSERGRAVNTVDKTEMGFQLERQGRITQELENERTAYETEMKQAKTIFGESSNEYRQARTQFYQIQEELKKSQTSELSLKHAIEELTFTVRGFVIDRIQSFVSKLGNIASLAEKRGTNKALGYEVTEDVFNEQIGYNNDLILKYAEDLQARKDEIARRTIEEGLEINSDAYQELYNKIVADEDAMYKLYSANEDLKMSIRNLRWKPFKEFQETLDKIESDFNHIQSFIREGELLDEDGQFTARGFTQIALIGENMDVAEKKIANARAAIEKLNDELAVGTINEETFGEEFEQQMKIIQDSASEAYDAMQKLADLYIKQITEENSILQDLIKSRQDALNKKKAYYDYDKQIREKNKDVNSLRAQVQALQNVSTDAAKAKRAQLQAQLAEAEEDLNETRYDHQIEMQQQGYEQLSEDMQKALDDAVKLINGDQVVLQQTAAQMLGQLETNHIDEKAVIADIVSGTGTKIHDETQSMINETLTATAALSEDAQGIANAVSAIATLLGQNPAIMADSLAQILGQLGNEGTLSQAISKFADENGIKINETGLEGVITAIAKPYDKEGEANKLFTQIYDSLGDKGQLYNEAINMKTAIGQVSKYLGTDQENTFTRLKDITTALGDEGTLSKAIKQFASENGIEIDGTSLEGVINEISAPFDTQGKASELFNSLQGVIKGDTDSLFNEASGMAGTISTISELLGTKEDSTFTRVQQILDNLGATGTLSQAITNFINEQGKSVDDETQSLIDKMTAPYDTDGRANILMSEIKNALTGTNGALKLLSDLKVEKKQNDDGTPSYTINVPQAITEQQVSDSVSAINTTVETKLDSIGNDVSKHLKTIEDAYLKLTSNLGTTGNTGKGEDNVADAEIIKQVTDMINALPTKAGLSDAGKVSEAQNAYDRLTDKQKSMVSEDAQKKLDTANQQINKAKEDKAEADRKAQEAEEIIKKKVEETRGKLLSDINIALSYGDVHKKSITKAEKNSHAAIWEYLVKNFGITGNNKVYTALAKALGVKVSKTVTGKQKDKILSELKLARNKYGFASGTKRVGKNMDAWTNEDWEDLGAEMIVRKSDGAILTPLKANDSVIPANLADNLFKWGAISPDKFLSNPFLGKMGDVPSNANVTNQVDQKVEMHFDSLFTIQGDVNADVMDRLEEFGKALTSDRNFQQNVVKFVTKDFVRESKKQGGFR